MLGDHFYQSDIESFPIHSSLGCDIEIEHKGIKYITEAPGIKSGYRNADFRISSYQGYGGVHFYGRISYGTYIREVGTNCTVFIGGMKIPDEARDGSITICRRIEDWEAASGEEVFAGCLRYEENELGTGFYVESILIDVVKKYLPQIFSGKWAVRCDYWDVGQETILIDN